MAKARGLPSPFRFTRSRGRASTRLMRAVAVVSKRLIAVVAEYTKASGVAMSLEPSVQFRPRLPLLFRTAVDVVDSQKFVMVIPATRAGWLPIAVMHQCDQAIALSCSSVFGTLHLWILLDKLLASQYLTAFTRPLETLTGWASGVTMKVVSGKGQFFPTYRTDSCRGRRLAHWCNPFGRGVTPIVAELKQGVKGEGLLAQRAG